MLEIGFPELILIAIVGLLVIGPERLPETLRTLGLWLGRMRRSFTAVKAEIEKEIGMDEVKRQLHNEAIMEEMKRIEAEVKHTADAARGNLNEGITAGNAAASSPGTGSAEQAGAAAERNAVLADPNVDGEISDLIAAQDGGHSIPAGSTEGAADDDRDHSDAGAESDDRDHTDAGADVEDDRDHSDAGAEPDSKTSSQRVTSG